MAKRSNAMARLKQFLNRSGWQYMTDKEQTLRGLMSGDNGQWNWIATQTDDDRFLMFCASSPVKVPPKKRLAVAEYLTRANWCFQFGNFEMNWSDGQVVLRTSIPITAGSAPPDAIEHLVYGNCSLMDRHLPGLLAVSIGNVKPAQAIADVQRGPDVPSAEENSAVTAGDCPQTPDASTVIPRPVSPSGLDGFSAGNN